MVFFKYFVNFLVLIIFVDVCGFFYGFISDECFCYLVFDVNIFYLELWNEYVLDFSIVFFNFSFFDLFNVFYFYNVYFFMFLVDIYGVVFI